MIYPSVLKKMTESLVAACATEIDDIFVVATVEDVARAAKEMRARKIYVFAVVPAIRTKGVADALEVCNQVEIFVGMRADAKNSTSEDVESTEQLMMVTDEMLHIIRTWNEERPSDIWRRIDMSSVTIEPTLIAGVRGFIIMMNVNEKKW